MPLLIKQLIDESADNAELSYMNIEPIDWRAICERHDSQPASEPEPLAFWRGVLWALAIMFALPVAVLVLAEVCALWRIYE